MTLSGGKTAPQPSGRGGRAAKESGPMFPERTGITPHPTAARSQDCMGRSRAQTSKSRRVRTASWRTEVFQAPTSAQPRVARHPNSRCPGADLSPLPEPQKPVNRAKACCLKPVRRDYSPPRSVTENLGKSLNFSLAQLVQGV